MRASGVRLAPSAQVPSRGECIEGTIDFDDPVVFRAGGIEQATDEFIEDGERWWATLDEGDDRLSPDAQRAAELGTPKWRTWAQRGETVTGKLHAE